MATFLLTSRGSDGDINPFIGIGRELRRRGHEVVLVVNDAYRSRVVEAGLGFESSGPEALHREEMAANSETPAARLFDEGTQRERFERFRYPEMRRTYRAIERRAGARPVVVARSWCPAGRIAEQALGLRGATVYVSPGQTPNLLLGLGAVPVPARLARTLYERVLSRMIDRRWDPIYGPYVNDFRHELGLPPIRGIRSRWLEGSDLSLGLWPAWYAHEKHWSPRMQTSGFVLDDGLPSDALPDDVEAFVGSGSPPIVFCAGTYRSSGAERFFAQSVAICRRLGRRGIVLLAEAGAFGDVAPEVVLCRPYLPLGALLSRASAIVHHGGIGTMARGMAAALPQLVVPAAFDQPLNAERVMQLGVGEWVPAFGYFADRVAPIVARLLDDPGVRARCQQLAERVRSTNGAAAASSALERLAR